MLCKPEIKLRYLSKSCYTRKLVLCIIGKNLTKKSQELQNEYKIRKYKRVLGLMVKQNFDSHLPRLFPPPRPPPQSPRVLPSPPPGARPGIGTSDTRPHPRRNRTGRRATSCSGRAGIRPGARARAGGGGGALGGVGTHTTGSHSHPSCTRGDTPYDTCQNQENKSHK